MIVDFFGGVYGSSTSDVIVTDLGAEQGVKNGSLLSIYKPIKIKDGGTIEDYAGLGIVIQTLGKSSLALVVESKEPLQKGFKVTAK